MASDKHDKTEKPTPKRKLEARKEGRVAKSADLVSWTAVLVATFLLPSAVGKGAAMGRDLFANVHETMLDPTPAKMAASGRAALGGAAGLLLPLLVGMAGIAIVANVAQVGFVLSTKAIKPSLKKLNPIAGFKKLFSSRNLWELGKSVAKLVIVGAVAYPTIAGVGDVIPRDHTIAFWDMVSMTAQRGLALVRRVAEVALVIAVADFAYQRKSLSTSLKMTKQQVKDEAKQAEGNQEIKGKIKAKQLAFSRNRMLSLVGGADVVVVNPIHIAVALKYEAMKGAPRVVAKGEGWVAEKIREEAEKHQVPIVESIPLARALYAAVDLEAEIGVEFYEPVARLLAFVQRLGRRRPMGGAYHRLPPSLEMAAPH